jgi:alpha-D-ribose 1-methylphosphonate 5-triphosphate synthase subunit PhnI
MVLYNTDGIESFGFVEHLKLPHFVTFGSGLEVSSNGAEDKVESPETELVDEEEARELVGVAAADGSAL